ncbi:hypothetical protein BH11ACT2_BH11ACT2_12670 [soil metagenome]
MQRIYYANGSILTGESIASAVLAYAQALAKSPLADTITIPFVDEGTGELSKATLLIGPASQLMFVPEIAPRFVEPADEQLVGELERKTLLIGSPRPVAQNAEEPLRVSDDYD